MDPAKADRRPPPRASLRAGESDSPITLTALRVGVGFIMVVHGWLKLTDAVAWKSQVVELGIPFPEVSAWLAIAGELLGGAGLVLGLLTRLASLGVLSTMITAIVTVHMGHGLLAKDGGYEYPLTIALVAAFFLMRGAGPYSIDAFLSTSSMPPRVTPTSRSRCSSPIASRQVPTRWRCRHDGLGTCASASSGPRARPARDRLRIVDRVRRAHRRAAHAPGLAAGRERAAVDDRIW